MNLQIFQVWSLWVLENNLAINFDKWFLYYSQIQGEIFFKIYAAYIKREENRK